LRVQFVDGEARGSDFKTLQNPHLAHNEDACKRLEASSLSMLSVGLQGFPSQAEERFSQVLHFYYSQTRFAAAIQS